MKMHPGRTRFPSRPLGGRAGSDRGRPLLSGPDMEINLSEHNVYMNSCQPVQPEQLLQVIWT